LFVAPIPALKQLHSQLNIPQQGIIYLGKADCEILEVFGLCEKTNEMQTSSSQNNEGIC